MQIFEQSSVSEQERRLAELYEAHALRALRLAFVLTGVRELAEDLVQEAFLRSFRRLDSLRVQEAFPGYLRQTILNLARAHLRRQKLERISLRRHVLLAEGIPNDAPDVEERESLWRALHRLPYRQRATLVLRFYEDMPEKEVARIMGTSVAAIKALASRGVRKLRAELAT